MLRLVILFVHEVLNINFRLLRFLYRCIERVDLFIEAIWLSFLSEKQFKGLIESFYKNDNRYTQSNKIKKGLFQWEMDIAKYSPIKDAKIVVIGAGGGRECWALNELGFNVSGYEPDSKMVEYAKRFILEKQLPIKYTELPANAIPNEKCDLFWFGWGVYTHIFGRDKRVDMLLEAKSVIPTNGYIIISYWIENRSDKKLNRLRKTINRFNRRNVESGESFKQGLWGKQFTKEQIKEEANLAKLKIIHISEKEYGHAILTPMDL